jgi:hypothetical protein
LSNSGSGGERDYGIPLRDEIELENGPEPEELPRPSHGPITGLRAGDSPQPVQPGGDELARTGKALTLSPAPGNARPGHAYALSSPVTRRKLRKCHEFETDLGVIAVRQAGKPR